MRRIAYFGLLWLAACVPTACAPAPSVPSPPAKAATSSVPRPSLPEPDPPRTPLTFESIDEAVTVLAETAESGDSDGRMDATKYLIAQGSPSIQPLGERLTQPDVPPRTAIAICRVLGQLGPTAASPLIAALDNESASIRVNATEQLAIIKPTNDAIVDKLIKLIDDDDQQIRLMAIRGLARIGKPAQKVSPKLQAIRNSQTENDTLRTAAGEALKKVDPRRSFVD